MIIAVDFDGVIVEDRYPEIGEPLPDMCEVMQRLWADGHILIINTCRADTYAEKAEHALCEMGIYFHFFNKNSPARIKLYGIDCRKISADIYIDDKNLGGFPGWMAAYSEIERKQNE